MSITKLKVSGILLDLDGTILDTKPAYIEAARVAFEKICQPLPKTAKLLEIPKRLEQKKPLADIVAGDIEAFLNVYLKAFYSLASSYTQLVPGAEYTIKTLSEKCRLAVITMRFTPRELVLQELSRFGVAKYVTSVVTALDTSKPKPSPQALIKAVSAIGVQMCDCVIVGDSVVDVAAGKAAGSKTVGVLSGLYCREELSEQEPNFIINDISELKTIIA